MPLVVQWWFFFPFGYCGRVLNTLPVNHPQCPFIQGASRRVWGYGGGAGGGGAGARARPAAGRVARRCGPAPALAPFPVPGRSSLWTASCCWGGWLVLVRGVGACRAVGGGLQPSSTSTSTSGLSRPVLPRRPWRVGRLGGFPART
jgi:hypothetical protein